MRPVVCALLVLSGAACAGTGQARRDSTHAIRPACPDEQYWDGRRCQMRGDGAKRLQEGTAALKGFRIDEALPLLEQARARGPHRHGEHVLIYEKLGIAHAYLGRERAALAAFEMLLSLDPEHLLSYTLSPKATFVFERARAQVRSRGRPALHLSWPYDLEVTRPVPIDIEVVADPKRFLHRAELHLRRKGENNFSTLDIDLPPVGGHRRITMPALGSDRPEVMQLYLTALDKNGNEVLLWSGAESPREIALGYTAPVPWYRKWWVWAAIGGVVATGTGTAVYALSRGLPDNICGILETR